MGEAPLPAGHTVYPPLPSKDRLDSAVFYLDRMIFGVETRPDGFDVDGVTWLVESFLLFVGAFRGPGDVPTMHHMWVRRHSLRPVPFGRKRSQHLVFLIKELKYLLGNAGQPAIKIIYDKYDEVRTTLFEFVSEFRSAMESRNHRDKEKFTRELERVTTYRKLMSNRANSI